jgi:hypothetical protein
MSEVECPQCGHEFDAESDQSEPEPDPEPIGECVDCGVDIYHGEWHVADRTDADRIPDEPVQAVAMGEPEPTTRWCGSCSDRLLDDFPNDEKIAGVDDE